MKKTAKVTRAATKAAIAALLAITMMGSFTIPATAQTFTVAVNNLKLRRAPGLNGKVLAYLGQGNRMDEYYTTGVIDGQLWRNGRMMDNDVAGLIGFASAAYLR